MKIKFSTDNELAMNFPPEPLKKHIPKWYKDMPADKWNMNARSLNSGIEPDGATVKSCIPVRDFLSCGYVIRNHSDILITPKELVDGIMHSDWHSRTNELSNHPHKHCPVNIRGKKNTYIKLINQWKVEVPQGYSCFFYQPDILPNENYKLFPAIVDTDDLDVPVHFPGVVLATESFIIKAGEPLMVVFPFKRDSWESEVEFVTDVRKPKILSFLRHYYRDFVHKKKKFT